MDLLTSTRTILALCHGNQFLVAWRVVTLFIAGDDADAELHVDSGRHAARHGVVERTPSATGPRTDGLGRRAHALVAAPSVSPSILAASVLIYESPE